MIVLSLFISGCPHKNDGYYPLAEEVYMMGWILRNINDSTPTVLEYKPEELSKYNYSYGFPGDLPSYYRNTNAWVAPFEWSVITSFVDFSAPSNRIHYLRADNALELSYGRDWSFSNMMYINLKNSDDEIERNFYNNEHKEHYKSENVFYGINPVPGEEVNVFFGTTPFIPTSVSTWHNTIFLQYPLLRGYNGNSYLSRIVETGYLTDEGEFVLLQTPAPWFEIYMNNTIVKNGNLTKIVNGRYAWNHEAPLYNAYEPGYYKILVEIPSGYPLFNITRITTEFYKDSDMVNLPILKKIEFPPSFSEGESLPISIEFENPESVEDVKLYVKRDIDIDWNLISTGNEGSFMVEGNPKSIDFMFTAGTQEGNVTYEMSAVSLRKEDISCSVIADDISGETILIGSCKDGIKNASNIRLDVIGDNLKIGSIMTDNYRGFIFSAPGEYENIKVKFDGTGVYKPKEFIPTFAPEHCHNRLMDFDEKGYDCSGNDCIPCSFFPDIYGYLHNQALIVDENNYINFTVYKYGTGKASNTKANLYLYDLGNRRYISQNDYSSGDMIEVKLRDRTKINLTFDIIDKRNVNITFEFNGKKIKEAVYSGKVFMLDDKYLVIIRSMRNEEIEGNYIGEWIDIYIVSEFEEFVKDVDDFEGGIVGMRGATFPTHVKLSPPKEKKGYFEYFLRERKNLYGLLYIQNEEDRNLENNMGSFRYTILNRDADIDVRFYAYGQFFFIDDNITVNLEIKNIGFTVAEDVNYTIYYNGTPIITKTIGELSYENYTLYINDIFVAETEGIFNVTVVVESSNDVNLSNNIGTRQIEVRKGKDARFNISTNDEPFIGWYYIDPLSYRLKEEDEGILDTKVLADENISYISKNYYSSGGDNSLQYSAYISHRNINVFSYNIDRGGVNTSGRADNNILAYFTVWNKVSFDFEKNLIYINIGNSSKLSIDLDEFEFFFCSEWDIEGYKCNGNWTESNSYIRQYDDKQLYISSGVTKAEAFALGIYYNNDIYCDNDRDGYTIFEKCIDSGYILGDCNDNDEKVNPDAIETCDRIDNDCNPETSDGANEVWLGGSCDGNDTDSCIEGVFVCMAGKKTCSDNSTDNLDLCDGLDNDCNATTKDGNDETWLRSSCDSTDSDLCEEGQYICYQEEQYCQEELIDNKELCDGYDNDCNPETSDGIDETWLGQSCDGADTDSCIEGVYGCIEGGQSCSDDTSNDDELCDGTDNDCDNEIDEDFPNLGRVCSEGIGACSSAGTYVCKADGSGIECNAVPGSPSPEICNDYVDNDCDYKNDMDDDDCNCKGTDASCYMDNDINECFDCSSLPTEQSCNFWGTVLKESYNTCGNGKCKTATRVKEKCEKICRDGECTCESDGKLCLTGGKCCSDQCKMLTCGCNNEGKLCISNSDCCSGSCKWLTCR